MTEPDVLALLLADARLPTGAHTQSAGLEAALAGGLDMADVLDYVRARLDTVVLVEAATAVLARRIAGMAAPDGPAMALLDTAWRARTPSEALRDNADDLGRGYLRLARRLWPAHAGVLALAGLHLPCRAVVVGVAAAAAGLDDVQLARLVGYDDAQAVFAAALKLVPMDPLQASAWLLAVAPDVAATAACAAGVSGLSDLPAGSAPLIDQWAQRHSQAARRLFRA